MLESNLLCCHACLSATTLTAVGEYIHIYRTICDNIGKDVTSQTNVCWECLALLKKVQAFKRKVENAQRILDLSVKQTVLKNNLSNLTLASIETKTFYCPVLDEEDNESENFMETSNISEPYSDLSKDLKQAEDTYNLVNEDSFCGILIEDVRSCCDILDGKPVLDGSISSSEVTNKVEPLDSPVDEDQSRHRRWKRSVLLVFKRICSHPHAVHFMRPVTDDIAPHYSNIVRRPTDLSTIRQRIKDGVIRTTAEFTRALLLMFSNALMYNSSHYDIYQMTVEFREETLRELSLLIEALAMAEWPLAAPPAPSAAPLHFTRRASVLERPKHEFMETPPPHRGRRPTLFEPQNPKRKEQHPNRSTLDRIVSAAVTRLTDHPSQERSSDKIKAAALRTRRATVFEPPTQHTLAKKRSKSPITVPSGDHPWQRGVTLDKIKAAPLRGRRATLSMQPPKPVALPSRSSDRIKAASLRGRRATVYEASQQPPKTVEHPTKSRSLEKTKAAPLKGRRSTVSMQPSKPVQHLSAKKRALDRIKAAPLRGRRATAYETSTQPIQLMEHSYAINLLSDKSKVAPWGGRRSTVYKASTQAPETVDHCKKPSSDHKAAPLRTRRATVFESKQNIQPVESSKKRPKWDWPSLEDKYLIAKKFKYTVAVL